MCVLALDRDGRFACRPRPAYSLRRHLRAKRRATGPWLGPTARCSAAPEAVVRKVPPYCRPVARNSLALDKVRAESRPHPPKSPNTPERRAFFPVSDNKILWRGPLITPCIIARREPPPRPNAMTGQRRRSPSALNGHPNRASAKRFLRHQPNERVSDAHPRRQGAGPPRPYGRGVGLRYAKACRTGFARPARTSLPRRPPRTRTPTSLPVRRAPIPLGRRLARGHPPRCPSGPHRPSSAAASHEDTHLAASPARTDLPRPLPGASMPISPGYATRHPPPRRLGRPSHVRPAYRRPEQGERPTP